ncbi:MAG: LpxL/LpxP family Kdo(2)-lipid IV(A) lauroyl/palmitoleoyl acyltransferase [Gammaproteobacteria bacterium]|nr:LpxL/LpxP family Kdo(2)-lipid IV(A) lauroyl/palmitoleoyl acyltransferase [Gammaproteobacteria bacterium]
MNTKERLNLLSPINWPAWLGIGCLWSITRLPISWQMRIGRFIGWAVYHCSPKLRRISAINLSLCFPQLSDPARETLLKKNFAALGMGLIETGMAWWLSDKRLSKCSVKVNGIEHLEQALSRGKGVILVSPHFMCLEMIGRLLGSRYSFAVMYRPHKKRILSYIQDRFRQKYRIQHIARHRIRDLINTFNANTAVWYAYDIDAGEKRSVFAPFFGIQTASLTSASRLAEISGAAVIPIDFYRLDDKWGYEINLYPILENFPGENYVADATRLNKQIEESIRNKPEQYIWQYKRFKTRPPGEKRYY